MTPGPPRKKLPVALRDCLFLLLLVAASAAPYLRSLGFYSDDWSILSALTLCPSQSTGALWGCILKEDPETRFRPLQSFERVLVYRAFGDRPLGYHLVNTAVFAIAVILLYLVLREFQFGRTAALTVASLYAALPHFSTDRFWFSAAQSNTSVAFALLCYLCVSRAASNIGARRWIWISCSVAGMMASLAAYEVCAPLTLVAPLVFVWLIFRRSARGRSLLSQYGRVLRTAALCALPFAAATLLKLRLQTRVKVATHFRFLREPKLVLQTAASNFVNLNWRTFTFGLPDVAWRIARHGAQNLDLIIAILTAIGAGVYLFRAAGKDELAAPWQPWARLFLTGVAVYLLASAVFFPYTQFESGLTGIENRKLIAMTCGVAMTLGATIGIVARLLRDLRWRRMMISTVAGLLIGSGSLVFSYLATYWHEAADRQNALLAEIQARMPNPQPSTVLLVHGVCPYVGPGIVFDGDELGAALRFRYRNPTLNGDVVNPAFKLASDHVEAWSYDNGRPYPYSPVLLMWGPGDSTACRFSDMQSAAACLAAMPPPHCPPGDERTGVPVLNTLRP